MKVLFVIKTLALPGGGAERVLTRVASGLASRGHHVEVVSFDAQGAASFYQLFDDARWRPVGIGDIRHATGVAEGARRARILRQIVKEARPDVAIGFMHSAYILLGLALVGTRVPVIASEHIAYAHYRSRPGQAALLRFAPFLVEAITVTSQAIAVNFPNSLRRRMIAIPNPVDVRTGRMADVRAQELSIKTVLSVGRLEEQKDHAALVSAFASLATRFPEWRLKIVGEGVLRKQIETQIGKLGLGARVTLPGATSPVGGEYEAAQIFAMPSLYESFGLTSAEALAHGLPVVGFADCPGTNEIVRHGVNGLLVDGPDRIAALANGLAQLMESAELRAKLGAAGPSSVSSYEPDRVTDRWEELLDEVVRTSSAHRPSELRA